MQMSGIGIWNTRTLNNINTNIPNFISLLNDQIILQPGSYLIQATAPACQVDAHQIRLQCINNASIGTIVYGTNAFSPQNRKSEMLVSQTESKLDTTLVVTQTMTLEIQHMGKIITIGNPNPGLVGMGYANGFTTNEIYTVVNIMKII
jgi:hypothetical protein